MGCHPSASSQNVAAHSEDRQASSGGPACGDNPIPSPNDVSQRIVVPTLGRSTPRPPSRDPYPGSQLDGAPGTPLGRTGSELVRSDRNKNIPSLPLDWEPAYTKRSPSGARCKVISQAATSTEQEPNFAFQKVLIVAPGKRAALSGSGGGSASSVPVAGNSRGSSSLEGGSSLGQRVSLPSWLIVQNLHRLSQQEMTGSQPDEERLSLPSPLGSEGAPLVRITPRVERVPSSRTTPSNSTRFIFESPSTRGMILQEMEEEQRTPRRDSGNKNPMEVTFDEFAQFQEFPAERLAGSTSTARFSLKSANSGSGSDPSVLRSPAAAGLPPTLPKQVAFNSISVLAPRCGADRIEVRKRLQGGYVEKGYELEVAVQNGQPWEYGYYPTAAERRMARERELQNEARSRKVLCPGVGLLWSHPSVEGGIPYPLVVLEEKYKRQLPFPLNQQRGHVDARYRWQALRFLLTVQQYLASLIRELTNPETLSIHSVVAAIELLEEFVAASHRDSCPHIRIRILLTQLLVQLMDTLVLLEEPERFVQEFSKVNETELIDLLGDVSLSQQATSDDVQRDLAILVQTLKNRQSNILHYILLMIDNCIWLTVMEARSQSSFEENAESCEKSDEMVE
jgi:hypothetical protein